VQRQQSRSESRKGIVGRPGPHSFLRAIGVRSSALVGGLMKKSVLWTTGLLAAAATAGADDAAFERVQYNAYYNSLRDAAVAYDHKDYARAFELSRRAACAGDKNSQSIIGRMYLLGQTPARAELAGYAWIKLAAEFNYTGFTALARKLEDSQTPEVRQVANARADALRKLYGMGAT